MSKQRQNFWRIQELFPLMILVVGIFALNDIALLLNIPRK